MNEPFSSLPDEALSQLLVESQAAPPPPEIPTADVLERVRQFSELHAALTTEPEGAALLYHVPGSAEVRAATIGGKLVVGRIGKGGANADACDLAFPQLTEMSRRHFEIEAADGVYLLRDLGSRNGTYLNGATDRICESVLKAGDLILAGGVTFAFSGD